MVHIIFIFSVIFAFSKYKNTRLVDLGFFIVAAFAALRYDYGNDYNSYRRMYDTIQYGVDKVNKEILYVLLNKITPSFYLLTAITALFFVWVVYRLVKKQLVGIYQGMALLIFIVNPYLFLMNLSAIRQCIAMCIFIIAIKYIQERKAIKYILLILLASLFHMSALVLLPVYIFVNDKPMSKLQTFLLVTGMLLLLFEGSAVASLVETGMLMLDNSAYDQYLLNESQNSLRATILTGVYFAYVSINLPNLKGRKLICAKLYLIGLFLGMLAFHLSTLTRIQMYFDIFSVVAIPSIIEYHLNDDTKGWKKLINLYIFPALILIIYILRYYSFFTNPLWARFTIYHTLFEAIL